MLAPRGSRREQIAAAILLVAALLSEPFLVSTHGDSAHDDVCRTASVTHDGSRHRFEGGDDTLHERPDHCYICHWLGSLRLMASSRLRETVLSPGHELDHAPAVVPSRVVCAEVLARAPPA